MRLARLITRVPVELGLVRRLRKCHRPALAADEGHHSEARISRIHRLAEKRGWLTDEVRSAADGALQLVPHPRQSPRPIRAARLAHGRDRTWPSAAEQALKQAQ